MILKSACLIITSCPFKSTDPDCFRAGVIRQNQLGFFFFLVLLTRYRNFITEILENVILKTEARREEENNNRH